MGVVFPFDGGKYFNQTFGTIFFFFFYSFLHYLIVGFKLFYLFCMTIIFLTHSFKYYFNVSI